MTYEIGGYFGLETFSGKEYHENLVALNCARNALVYLLKLRKYKRLFIPYFLCDSVREGAEKAGVNISYYSLTNTFTPQVSSDLHEEDAVYLVNYYGQLSDEIILRYEKTFRHIIVDNVQAFFQKPLPNIDTIYSCRKYFGVADGAYLSTNAILSLPLEKDSSAAHMLHVLGRCDCEAGPYYETFQKEEALFTSRPVRAMSKLTQNLLCAIDYEAAKKRRTQNAAFLHNKLNFMNQLPITIVEGMFMYPFYLPFEGKRLRKYLQKNKIYAPCLWNDVFQHVSHDSLEYHLAQDIVPLPCDQRYSIEDMSYIQSKIHQYRGDST